MNSALNRRMFLKGSAVAVAAMGVPAIIPATAFGANERIALGVIGSGDRGMLNARNLMASGDCRIVAVCDARHS
ncbi:MAG: twin-arginine translocation signal domain-containing protein, partial [Lentisphaerae bacterium]|nr:twin-arginine translocation signal domain-containing protein [Lentisphaerota bacterium]